MDLITIINAFDEPIEMKDQMEKGMTYTILKSKKSLSLVIQENDKWVFLHRR